MRRRRGRRGEEESSLLQMTANPSLTLTLLSLLCILPCRWSWGESRFFSPLPWWYRAACSSRGHQSSSPGSSLHFCLSVLVRSCQGEGLTSILWFGAPVHQDSPLISSPERGRDINFLVFSHFNDLVLSAQDLNSGYPSRLMPSVQGHALLSPFYVQTGRCYLHSLSPV